MVKIKRITSCSTAWFILGAGPQHCHLWEHTRIVTSWNISRGQLGTHTKYEDRKVLEFLYYTGKATYVSFYTNIYRKFDKSKLLNSYCFNLLQITVVINYFIFLHILQFNTYQYLLSLDPLKYTCSLLPLMGSTKLHLIPYTCLFVQLQSHQCTHSQYLQ